MDARARHRLLRQGGQTGKTSFLHQEKGYRSRAAFKLLQLQTRHEVIKSGDKVIDLGCAPGSWLQLAVHFSSQFSKVSCQSLPDLTQKQFQEVSFKEKQ